jgi:hypothetical protein
VSAYRRLAAHYRRADKAGRVNRGRDWYPRMREILDAERGEHSLEQAVAVFAITSQGAQLRANLDWTRRALAGDTDVGRFPNRQGPKIREALADPATAHEACVGPKIGAFFAAVAGDPDALVLDRWATFAALGDEYDRDTGLTVKQRKACEDAYRRLAAETGEEVRAIQAAIWLQVRETTPHAKHGKAPQLWDITS